MYSIKDSTRTLNLYNIKIFQHYSSHQIHQNKISLRHAVSQSMYHKDKIPLKYYKIIKNGNKKNYSIKTLKKICIKKSLSQC